jgi:serine phosphatase RsbU (regulator of sigma subunit)/anti-sigma regulatory factor (Ser/Thr protein kinase)
VDERRAVTARDLSAQWDWGSSPLGPEADWPVQLRDAWALVLDCPVPMALLCGPEFLLLYNDAFARLLGTKHPLAFAQPSREVVAEVWEDPRVGPLLRRTLYKGSSFLDEVAELSLLRGPQGHTDLGFFLRAGSPVLDDAGRPLAVLHVVVETSTAIGRSKAIASLATSLAVAVTVDDVCKAVLRQAMGGFDAISASIALPTSPGGWRVARRHRIEELSPEEERLPLIWDELGGDLATLVPLVLEQGTPHYSSTGEVVAIPLRAGRAEAVLVVRRGASPVPHDVLAVVGAFTDLVGVALSRAVVFDAERSTAELLQRTLLPSNLPQSDAISIAARYEPVSEGTVAGGDFYDSFFLPDGRLAMVIGDVVGRGVMAATVMGQVRAAVRGAALTDCHPASVMSALDRVVLDLDALWPASMPLGTPRARPGMSFGGELFVTMLFGIIDQDTGDVELASAGHPLPARLTGRLGRGEGRPRCVIVDLEVGPPLGISGQRPVHRLHLDVGDMLLAYTDGLLERRGEDLHRGEERLRQVLESAPPGTPRSIAQQVMEAMVLVAGQEDDCAVLTVGRSPEGHRRAAVVVPPMPESVKAARDWARETLEGWRVAEGDQHTIVTGVSELITNSVLHAGTESHLTMDLDGGAIAVTVADSGNRGEPILTGADTMAVRGRGLSLVRAISDTFGAHRTSAGTTVWFEVAVAVDPAVQGASAAAERAASGVDRTGRNQDAIR